MRLGILLIAALLFACVINERVPEPMTPEERAAFERELAVTDCVARLERAADRCWGAAIVCIPVESSRKRDRREQCERYIDSE